MKANRKGAVLLQKMMDNKQQRIHEARLEYAATANGNKPATAIPVQSTAGQA